MGRTAPAAPIAVGEPVRLSERIVRLTAPNPGVMTGPGTNTYLVGTDDLAVIDPGPDDDGHLDAIVAAGSGCIRAIVVTHTHTDHWPAAPRLAARTGATTFAFDGRARPAGSGEDEFEPQRRLADGDRLTLDGGNTTIEAVHTPGHASNHLCYLLVEEGVLFSGDHVMQGSTVVISPPDGDMAVYLESLARVRAMSPRAIAPGHGTLIDNPIAKVDEYLAHRHEREVQVERALLEGDRTIDAIVARLYADVKQELHPVAARTVHAHLLKLRAEGRAAGDGADGEWAPAR
jgi:glyoxylase-like metal-dependent hydrolase (beta-lactamase superfamily II)